MLLALNAKSNLYIVHKIHTDNKKIIDLKPEEKSAIKFQTTYNEFFTNEKEIQSIVESNLKAIFDLEFIATEFPVNNFRLDTLAFDRENNSFVIIEYKNSHSYSVVDQGYTYLSLLLD